MFKELNCCARSLIAVQGAGIVQSALAEGEHLTKVAICDYEYPKKYADVIDTMKGYSTVTYYING